MDDVNIVYNKEQRNSAFEDLDAYDVQVLGTELNLFRHAIMVRKILQKFKKMVWYVLHNSDETAKYRRHVFTY
jgi:hypothetical protein